MVYSPCDAIKENRPEEKGQLRLQEVQSHRGEEEKSLQAEKDQGLTPRPAASRGVQPTAGLAPH